ncbi:unnamed protein product, partial [marine sediment metagenome]
MNSITNPENGRVSRIDSIEGQLVLQKYVNQLGGKSKCKNLRKGDNECQSTPECEWIVGRGCQEIKQYKPMKIKNKIKQTKKKSKCRGLRKRDNECQSTPGCSWHVGIGCQESLSSQNDKKLVSKPQKKPVYKKDKKGAKRLSAKSYLNEGGQYGDVVDIRGDGELKCLLERKNGTPYWAKKTKK